MRQRYTIAIGTSRLSKEWTNKEVTWPQLVRHLADSRRTSETLEEYRAMTREQKGAAKDHGGFVGGALTQNGPRKASTIASRSLITLDIDYGREGVLEKVSDVLLDTAYAVYSTHSHTPQAPRYRLVVPMDRDLTPDEYIAASRRLAEQIDIEQFDDKTYEPPRLMYWPSTPKDVEPVFVEGKGAPLHPDDLLDSYADWRDVSSWPRSSRETQELKGATGGRKAEDPTLKPGVIGAFCRTYTVSEARAEFLADVYEQVSDSRWNYIAGEGAPGVLVYEDKWVYSMHGTDPAQGRLLNAFDLVRIHRFGDLDADALPGTPLNRLPSYTAMTRFAGNDDSVRALMAVELVNSFRREETAAETKPETGAAGAEPDTSWTVQLAMDKKREHFLPTPSNVDVICTNDEGLKGATRYDIFTDRNVLVKDLPWSRAGDDHREWNNFDDNELLIYISRHYDISNKTAILDAHDAVMARDSFHPVRDYLKGLSWDGRPRLDTLIIDFLDAEDDPDGLTRAMTRKHFTAAVARVMTPGVKYDQVLALAGPEGAGKSQVIARMGMEWCNDSFSPSNIEDKSAMEQIRGSWLIEMAEMTAYKKSTAEAFKAFMSKRNDEYRPAYARKKVNIKRQCVFFTTTNEVSFLKGDTGNRRFWVIQTLREKDRVPEGKLSPFTDLTQDYVDQVWAEAVTRWRAGEKLFLEGRLSALVGDRQEQYNEIETDDRRGLIEAYIATPVPEHWYEWSIQKRADFFKNDRNPFGDVEHTGETMRRKYICVAEIAAELFRKDMNRYERREINQMLNRIPGLVQAGSIRTNDVVYGGQRRYEITEEFWAYVEVV